MAAETHVKAYRAASSGDVTGILKVFAEVAFEVPTSVLPQTEGIVQRLVASGQSWVATDADGSIVGYALAEPHDSKTLSLVYLGVSKPARNQHVSSSLISKLQEMGAPIITDVRSNNKSSMVERFEHFGFVKSDANADRTKLRWDQDQSDRFQIDPEGHSRSFPTITASATVKEHASYAFVAHYPGHVSVQGGTGRSRGNTAYEFKVEKLEDITDAKINEILQALLEIALGLKQGR
jgi:N-acetylglutamate synthase-like GNAT family acetyltransferase